MSDLLPDPSTASTSALGKAVAALDLRSIGPAFMGGRIADIAIHPSRPRTWYVAVGSGGVWKTTNAGTTWKPVFDDQAVYSIGCVTIDPARPDVVWVGSGEAVSGRHVSWGDGVYRSLDGGATWQNMGLAHSEHISEILVDPRDTNTVYVAAEGPLWSAGGDRGVYKTTDGGGSWSRVLEIDADTGVTALAFAPDDPDVVYAASYQRRRRVWGFLAGGPGSGIHKSTDGGTTWRRMSKGLPEGHMGRIGLAVTPADPNIVYATIEADEKDRGFYRSTDRGESWERRNDYLSGGTGPHYYQEIYASPTDPERVYQVDVFVHWTRDGGATFNRLENGRTKHADNHVVWIDPHDGDHLIVGADAGLYESFDHGETFRHVPNLPISQFYRVAADNSEPFYDLLGGAQDLGTLLGPARTTGVEGVRNQDWTVTLGADGYHVAFDPTDPSICYMEWQNGNVMRMDRRTMQLTDIMPMPGPEDAPERWNWDCPIVVSSHDPARIHVASQRVWRSDDRGDSWRPISPDLTRNINRYELPIAPAAVGGTSPGVDALWDHRAMSGYSTISHLGESPLVDGLLYVGTDDGLVQATDDAGQTWRKCAPLPDFPTDGFVNNVVASPCDPDTVFVAADAHKNGDYTPFLFKSTDRGASWISVVGDLPASTIVWCVAQDHIEPDLLFAGTEFGLYATLDGGRNWHRLVGVPTIAVRDIELHRRDTDLIAATFGRGFYVLDDYGPLRELRATLEHADDTEATGSPAASLFEPRDAWWFVPHQTAQAEGQPTLGSTAFAAPNPDVGACFTYYLASDVRSAAEERRDADRIARSEGDDVEFPGWDRLHAEEASLDPRVYLVIRDGDGSPVRRLRSETKAGLHRATWDLRIEPAEPVQLDKPGFREPWDSEPKGPLAMPGTYRVELSLVADGHETVLAGPQEFFVRPLPVLAADPALDDAIAFHHRVWSLQQRVLHAAEALAEARTDLKRTIATVERSTLTEDTFAAAAERHRAIERLGRLLEGDAMRARYSEATGPSIKERVGRIAGHLWETTRAPTDTQRDSFAVAEAAFAAYAAAAEANDVPLDRRRAQSASSE